MNRAIPAVAAAAALTLPSAVSADPLDLRLAGQPTVAAHGDWCDAGDRLDQQGGDGGHRQHRAPADEMGDRAAQGTTGLLRAVPLHLGEPGSPAPGDGGTASRALTFTGLRRAPPAGSPQAEADRSAVTP